MKHFIQHSKTFRYFSSGNLQTARTLLYVLHGYGQLAEYFMKKFEGIPKDHFIVAPEGMHRFYLNGNSGRVGASWMTKEERETDISDNISWLNALDKEIQKDKRFEKVIVLGFSQGGATAARWFYSNTKFDTLIMWASVFPPDLNIKDELLKIDTSSSYFVLGEDDEYFQDDLFHEEINKYKDLGFKTKVFEGKHDIDIATLSDILKE